MLLSIVIPNYNIPKELLQQCVDSILSQGVPDEELELIVVDDGSLSPPVWIKETYARRNVRLVQNEHQGPGAARNRGIEEAAGKYIQFVDADDFLFENGQLSQCLAMLKAECPQILRFKYAVRPVGARPPKIGRKKVKFSNTISGAAHMRSNNLSGSPCTYFFLKALAVENEIRFPAGIFHEDEEFNTQLHYHAQTLIESNAVLYCYCLREGSTTSSSSKDFEKKRLDDIFTVIKRLVAFKESNAATANALQRAGISRKLNTLAVDAILNLMYNGCKAKDIYSRCISQLFPLGLFPLSRADYSLKYKIFRFLANRKWGMRVLRLIIPKHKPVKK